MDLYYGQYTLLMDNILSCPILSYILIYLYFCRPLYTLLYILHSHRIFYTTLIYSFICLFIYSFIYSPIYSLLSYIYSYTLTALLILPPPFYTSLLYSLLSLIYLPLLFSYSSTLILLYPLSYIERV